jgi:hypothetical protein
VRQIARAGAGFHPQRVSPRHPRWRDRHQQFRCEVRRTGIEVQSAGERRDADARIGNTCTGQRIADRRAHARIVEFAAEQFPRRIAQALQVQVESLHAAAANLHRSEVAVVDQRQRA